MLTFLKLCTGLQNFTSLPFRVGEICDTELQDNLQNGLGGDEKAKKLAAKGGDAAQLSKVSSVQSFNGSLQSENEISYVASTKSLNVSTDDKKSHDNEREYE
jgi:hypothetical protein